MLHILKRKLKLIQKNINKKNGSGGNFEIEESDKSYFMMTYNGKGPDSWSEFIEISEEIPSAKIIYNWFYSPNDDMVGGGGVSISNGKVYNPTEELEENDQLKEVKIDSKEHKENDI